MNGSVAFALLRPKAISGNEQGAGMYRRMKNSSRSSSMLPNSLKRKPDMFTDIKQWDGIDTWKSCNFTVVCGKD